MPEAKIHNSNKPILLYDRNILLFALQNMNSKYGVSIHFEKDHIHYKIKCKYLDQVSDNVFQILLDREQVYINNQEPDIKLYELADQMAKAIYPLILNIDRERAIIAIDNHKEIVARCKETQKRLSQYYVGEYSERYINAFGRQYSNPNILINHIEQELFFKLFFLPIQGLYDDRKEKKIQYKYVSSKNNVTAYNLNVRLDPVYTYSGKILANVVSDEMINIDKCFQAEYLLYPEDHSIFSIRGSLIQDNYNRKAQKICFEVYHLDKEERVREKEKT